MFSASKLTDDQKSLLHQWAAEGASIADLQRRIKDEFEFVITYLDARFLVLDLGVKIQEAAEEDEAQIDPGGTETNPDSASVGKVSVTQDSIAVPGAIVSGRVTFADGEGAIWMIDQMGRPGLDPDTPGYRPSQGDIEEFQKQLSTLMRRAGM